MKYILCAGLLIISYLTSISQNLRLEDIMKGDEYVGHQPSNHRWSRDGNTVFFDWNPNNEFGSSTYFWKEGMAKPEILPLDRMSETEIPISKDNDTDVQYYVKNGSIYKYSSGTKKISKVYVTSERISGFSQSTDNEKLYFRKDDNLYSFDVNDASVVQLTNFRKTKKADRPEKETFLIQQQKELFSFIQDKNARKKWNEERVQKNKEFFPKEYVYEPYNLSALAPTPDGKYVVFTLTDMPESKPTKVEHFITEDGYTNSENARQKVSIKTIGKYKCGIYSTEMDTFYHIDFTALSGIKDLPAYLSDYPLMKDKEKMDRSVRFFAPVFDKNGKYAIMDVRSQDNKDRWIVSINLATGKFTEVDHQHDDAWISGPGIGGFRGTLGFLNDEKTVYFQSEKGGYSHLYMVNLENGDKKALTSGSWEVRDVELSNDGSTFYLTTNTSHPGNRDFYHLDIATSKMTPILKKDGAHETAVSPDGKKILVRYSYKNTPWELYIGDNNTNPALKKITKSTTSAYDVYKWKEPEVVTFKAADGQTVYARLYKPNSKKKNKAAIIFVHGAGYLQNAHNHWSTYTREYMFHNMMADKGYTILDIDYRGSDGYGRDVRTGIYRYMGGLDLSDQLDGKKYLVDNMGIDNKRVGIYGGSYGGFITLMGLLTKPGTFKAGAALRSVTDWAHYNHGYTSNILNFPETDSIAYYRSSPINFAQNLQDKLVMLHGMVDDNVQFQDIVRLTQRFIELGKKNWDLAVFPVEAHGFVKTYSWVDEYRRIAELFDSELLR